MKYLTYFFLITTTIIAQPNPQERYPERIAEITKILEKDSLNYELTLERLEMQVCLLDGEWIYEPFFIYPAVEKNSEKLRVKEYEKNFDKIYLNNIKPQNFKYAKERDFYLHRGLYYSKTRQFNNAIDDFKHLLDTSIEPKHSNGEYYIFFALDMLFNLYIIENEYEQALKIVNLKLDEEKKISVERYFSYANSSYSKIKLLKRYGKKNEIISYLKQLSRDNFEYYFRNISNVGINLKDVMRLGYEYLGQLVDYLIEFDNSEKQKYIDIYRALSTNQHLNSDLKFNDLKTIVEKI